MSPYLVSRRAVARAAAWGLVAAGMSVGPRLALAQDATPAATGAPLSPADIQAIAMDAYIYGYSLITTEVTRVQMTNVPKATNLQAPMGQFANVPRYPPADYRGVSAPNADTFYSVV